MHIYKTDCKMVTECDIEIVERKGIGHPDTICDAVMEEASRLLSREYLRSFGRIFHHNCDKALLAAGQVERGFGYGRVVTPMRSVMGDRDAWDLAGLPVNDVDVILLMNVLHELPPWRLTQMFEVYSRILKSNGGVVYVIDMQSFPGAAMECVRVDWTGKDSKDILESGGFTLVHHTIHSKKVDAYEVKVEIPLPSINSSNMRSKIVSIIQDKLQTAVEELRVFAVDSQDKKTLAELEKQIVLYNIALSELGSLIIKKESQSLASTVSGSGHSEFGESDHQKGGYGTPQEFPMRHVYAN